MRVLRAGTASIVKILGKQKIQDDDYRLLKYTITKKCDEGTLLHNVITGELLLLDIEESKLLTNFTEGYSELMKELINKWFLVPVDFKEAAMVVQLRHLLKKLDPVKKVTNYEIMTTTGCNARCFYCFEKGVENINMSIETADKLINYIEKHKANRTVSLQWFGGEPLVNASIIDYICSRLKSDGVPFKSVIITNGFLVSNQIIQRSVELWNLKMAQITLDGTEEVYNRTKNYISSIESPFRVVLGNIQSLLDNGIQVNLRLNVNKENYFNLLELLDEIKMRFGKNRLLKVYSRAIIAGDTWLPNYYNEEDDPHKWFTEMEKIIPEKGLNAYSLQLPELRIYRCEVDSGQGIRVFPNGEFYPCDHAVSERIGDLDQGMYSTFYSSKWKKYVDKHECEECPLFPSCVQLEGCYERKICNFTLKQGMISSIQTTMKKILKRSDQP